MQNETVHNKLRRMESLLQQVPEDARTLYKFRITHTENDFVGMAFSTAESHYIGFSAEANIEISVRALNDKGWYIIDIEAPGICITLYGGADIPSSHITILPIL
jgi:hypothetical protein